MNKKADLASPIIMWFTILILVIILATWYASNIRPLSGEDSLVHFDLRQIFIKIDLACNSNYFESAYNPRLEFGNLTFNQIHSCISTENINLCYDLSCEVISAFFDLAKIIDLKFLKENSEITI